MKKGKIFGIINIIDLLIVIVVIAVIAGIFVRFGLTSNKGFGNGSTFEYVVRVDNIREYTAKGIEQQGAVYAEKSNVKIGEITNVAIEPYKDDEVTLDGNREFFERPDKFTAYVTIKAKGTEHMGAYFDADKEEVGIGRESKLCTKHVSTNGIIISLNTVES